MGISAFYSSIHKVHGEIICEQNLSLTARVLWLQDLLIIDVDSAVGSLMTQSVSLVAAASESREFLYRVREKKKKKSGGCASKEGEEEQVNWFAIPACISPG